VIGKIVVNLRMLSRLLSLLSWLLSLLSWLSWLLSLLFSQKGDEKAPSLTFEICESRAINP